jgi:carbon storage regulator
MSLVLNRKTGQSIVINRPRIKVKIVSVNGNSVRLAIDAPRHINIAREELTVLLPTTQSVQDHEEVAS